MGGNEKKGGSRKRKEKLPAACEAAQLGCPAGGICCCCGGAPGNSRATRSTRNAFSPAESDDALRVDNPPSAHHSSTQRSLRAIAGCRKESVVVLETTSGRRCTRRSHASSPRSVTKRGHSHGRNRSCESPHRRTPQWRGSLAASCRSWYRWWPVDQDRKTNQHQNHQHRKN